MAWSTLFVIGIFGWMSASKETRIENLEEEIKELKLKLSEAERRDSD